MACSAGDAQESEVAAKERRARLDPVGIEVPAHARAEGALRRHDLAVGTWHKLGKIPIAGPGAYPPDVTPAESTEIEPESEPDGKREPFVIIEQDGTVYSVDIADDVLEEAARVLDETEGFSKGGPGDGPMGRGPFEEELVPKAWGYGTDNRSPYGQPDYPAPSPEYEVNRKIGQIGLHEALPGFCTGTLVAADSSYAFYLTAAHCLFEEGSGNLLPNLKFYPGRYLCQNKWGTVTCSTFPNPVDVEVHGEYNSYGYMVYSYFEENCAGLSSMSKKCISRDIALVRSIRPSGTAIPGEFGWAAFPNSYIKDHTSYHRGYPNCGGQGDPDAPGGSASSSNVCRAATLYGSTGTIGDTYNDGRRTKFSHDISRGHSGGPLFLFYQGWPVVYAVASAGKNDCFDGCGTGKPNHAARITGEWEDAMLYFMGL